MKIKKVTLLFGALTFSLIASAQLNIIGKGAKFERLGVIRSSYMWLYCQNTDYYIVVRSSNQFDDNILFCLGENANSSVETANNLIDEYDKLEQGESFSAVDAKNKEMFFQKTKILGVSCLLMIQSGQAGNSNISRKEIEKVISLISKREDFKKDIAVEEIGVMQQPETLSANIKHIQFKGIFVTGNAESINEKLKASGFEYVYEDEGSIMFNGKFAGYDDCCVIAHLSDITKEVYCISITLPETDSWLDVKSKYDSFKVNFTEKYGKPASDIHYFSSPYEEMDGHEMLAIEMDKCFYQCRWDVEGGAIGLKIIEGTDSGATVLLLYEDEIGKNTMTNEKNQIMLEDL